MKGGRIIAGDLNPMANFLTTVLIRPINLATLKSSFEDVAVKVSKNIIEKYWIKCPKCKQTAIIRYLVWSSKPEAAQIDCKRCGPFYLDLPAVEVRRQLELSQIQPRFWFPKNSIRSTRKPPVEHHYELFTGRNLSMLAELRHTIEKVPEQNLRDALLYVFTAMLYSCSSMQMFSEEERSSSRGWTALRYYIPPKRKEVNVWRQFEHRFDNFMKCKQELSINRYLASVRVTDSLEEFFKNQYEALVINADAFDLIRRVGSKADMVFLDPPYIDDIDYFGFSEFWGAWLKMHFDFDNEWHPRKNKAEFLKKLLISLKDDTSKSCEICLAFAPKRQKGWNEEECIKESKYHIKCTGFFNYDNSHKRGVVKYENGDRPNTGAARGGTPDRFTILRRGKSKNLIISNGTTDNVKQFFPYLRVAHYLHPSGEKSYYDKTPRRAVQYIPDRLSQFRGNLKDEEIGEAIFDERTNKNTYHSLCYFFLRIILSKDGWKISYVDTAQFEDDVFGMVHNDVNCIRPSDMHEGIAFVAQKDDKKILFCFDDQEAALLKNLSSEVKDIDNGEFKNICVMIVKDYPRMQKRRRVTEANKWPRGFFLCFPEIRTKAEKLNATEYSNLCARAPIPEPAKPSPIMSVTAEVKENISVGGSRSHFKLRFKLKFKVRHSFNIIPGQFIMVFYGTTGCRYRTHKMG